ncbi:unnamed protein product [Leptidea sinapis]|uniref:MADF domain-containing protein n=1 Tax=Leptidea sinapis TaxID=189913 RepID=A0A5E4QK46_9NEOP|nr:unnamed protein product [Leptidea sinapis]
MAGHMHENVLEVISERKFTAILITLYRKSPVLWNTNSKYYLNKKARRNAVQRIINVLRRYKPNFDEEMYKKKINTLRTNYNKETRKLERMKQSGVDVEPSLWYYDKFSFIKELDTECEETDQYTDFPEETYIDCSSPEPTPPKIPKIKEETNLIKPDSSPQSYSQEEEEEDNNYDSIPYEYDTVMPLEQMDSYTHWGLSCAADLKNMDKVQQIYAKRMIAEIIMEGQLGKLHRNSVKINVDE